MRDDAPTSRTVLAGGLNHRILEWSGEGDTLLLLHGFLDCGGSFSAMVRQLPADLHIVAMDFRGHGESEWVGSGGHYNFYDYVRDVRDVVDDLRHDRLHVLGHSMGGGVSLLFTGSWPEDVERLIVVEGLGPPPEDIADGPDRMRRWIKEVRELPRRVPRKFKELSEVAERLMARQPRLSEERALEMAAWLAREADGGWFWRHDPAHRVRGPKIYQVGTYVPFLHAIACPVLLVTGSESWYRWEDLPERRRQLRDWRLVEIPDSGHMVHQDQPERLAEAVAAFLSGA
jgi:pimeloyl-ACP methyl ester carboxylesterase